MFLMVSAPETSIRARLFRSQARGDVVPFESFMGHAGFVSHQWVAKQHPDPEFKQIKVLQEALRRLLSTSGAVSLDLITEGQVPNAKAIPFQDFQQEALFLWYDYFSVPQLLGGEEQQGRAIDSIPAYVAKCRHFFALCPCLASSGHVLSTASWCRRGWCRLERASRELSQYDSWILIQSPSRLEVVGTSFSLVGGSVGEGDFTVVQDREKLAPVMRAVLSKRLMLSLQAGDLPSFRRHLNLQSVHLRGLDVALVSSLVPSGGDEVTQFLHQNGLTRVAARDAAGWCPLHYAALCGRRSLIEGLLARRADPNRLTSKDEPKLGFPFWMSALDLAVFYKHNEAATALISARAQLRGGLELTICWAAQSDNPEAIRLLQAARCDLRAKSVFGFGALETAVAYGAFKALDELVRHAPASRLELSRALHAGMAFRGGSAEMVLRLLHLRADMNFQFQRHRDHGCLARLYMCGKSLQHSLGRSSMLTTLAYHQHGMTPLMNGIQSQQYEGCAALIVAGARLDLSNGRGWTAHDFARHQAIPVWLQQGLEGDAEDCEAVCALALPHVEASF